jgi:hypothetical protein
MSRPYTVVLLPDSTKVHEADLRDVDAEDIHIAHVLAPTVSAATALAQNMCSQLDAGPVEPIDWAVLFVCEGHHRDIKNQPDTLNIPLSPKEVRALVTLLFSPGSFAGNLSTELVVSMLDKFRAAGNEINLWEKTNEG